MNYNIRYVVICHRFLTSQGHSSYVGGPSALRNAKWRDTRAMKYYPHFISRVIVMKCVGYGKTRKQTLQSGATGFAQWITDTPAIGIPAARRLHIRSM